MILMIDNYDSFTYNLVQYLGQLGVRGGRAPQRRDHRRGDRGHGAGGDLPLARPLHAERGGHHRRGDPALSPNGSPSWASAWDTRPSATPSAAEVVRAEQGHARQDLARLQRRPDDLPGSAQPLPGRPLPLAPRASGIRSPPAWRSAPRRRKGRSWDFATATIPSRGSSSTPSRS